VYGRLSRRRRRELEDLADRLVAVIEEEIAGNSLALPGSR
jgi:hypothetical protein